MPLSQQSTSKTDLTSRAIAFGFRRLSQAPTSPALVGEVGGPGLEPGEPGGGSKIQFRV
jgi:hypothetical protein